MFFKLQAGEATANCEKAFLHQGKNDVSFKFSKIYLIYNIQKVSDYLSCISAHSLSIIQMSEDLTTLSTVESLDLKIFKKTTTYIRLHA